MHKHIKPYHLALFAILLFAFIIRIFPRLLLPYFYMDDESINMVIPILKMIHSHSWDPHFYKYGTIIHYLTIPFYEIYFHIKHLSPLPPPSLDFLNPPLYSIGRYESAVFDILTILVTYKVGERLFNRKVAFLALVFMVFNPLELFMSHLFKPDTFMTFFAMCVFYFSIRLKEKEQLRWYILAGIFSGFAMSTRLDFFVILMPITGWFIYYYKTPDHDSIQNQNTVISQRCMLNPSYPPLEKGGDGGFEVSSPPFSKALQKRKNIAVFLLVAFVAFFLTSPYLVLHIPEFLHKIYHEFSQEQHLMLMNSIWNNRFVAPFIFIFPAMLSITVYLLSVFGIFLYAKKNGLYPVMFLLIYPVAYVIVINIVSSRPSYIYFSYFYLTVVPFLVLFAAYCFIHLIDVIRQRYVVWLMISLVLVDITFASFNLTEGSFVYNKVGDWIYKNIPKNSSILILNSFRPILGFRYYVYPLYTEDLNKETPLQNIINSFNPGYVIVSRQDENLVGGHIYFHHIMTDNGFQKIKIFIPNFTLYGYLFSPLIPDAYSGGISIYKHH